MAPAGRGDIERMQQLGVLARLSLKGQKRQGGGGSTAHDILQSEAVRREIWKELTCIFQDVFDDPTIVLSPSTSARDIASWDSGKTVMLILRVEDRFQLKLKSREIDSLRTVGDWASLLETLEGRG